MYCVSSLSLASVITLSALLGVGALLALLVLLLWLRRLVASLSRADQMYRRYYLRSHKTAGGSSTAGTERYRARR